MSERIYLSPPEVSGKEQEYVAAAIASGWLAPLGPELEKFESELALETGKRHCAALSSGTAALHLALMLCGARAGTSVYVPSLTFVATANAVRYTGAWPVFIDSTRDSWNIDPDLLAETLAKDAAAGRLPVAVIAVDLFGQTADYSRIVPLCRQYNVPLIEDAAESLGARYRGQPAGRFGDLTILSFNGNKIITTSGGGALLSDNHLHIERARYLSTQARSAVPEYHHEEVGYNYRLSNLLAALGRAQLEDLDRRVHARRRINADYRRSLAGLPGLTFMPEAPGCMSSFWLSCIQINPEISGVDVVSVHAALARKNIESRPVWKPMHLQPIYRGFRTVGGRVSEDLYRYGLCLPSGSALSLSDQEHISDVIRHAFEKPEAQAK